MTRKEPPRIDPASLHNILLIRLRRIGDVVMTTPAVRVLKANWPHVSLTYAIEEPYLTLLEGHPALDNIIAVPPHAGIGRFLRLAAGLRRRRFDTVIDFHGGPRAFMLAQICGAKKKIGYAVKYKHVFYDIAVPRSPRDGHYHSVESHINLVKALGAEAASIPPLELAPSLPEEKAKISAFMAETGLDPQRTLILHIGAGNRFRDWGVTHLDRLLHILREEKRASVVLIGGHEDLAAAEDLLERNRSGVYSQVASLNLREIRELIASAAVFVGPDSGPMHIAASTATPIVALFGPTLPAHFAPWKARATLLEKDIPCRPCPQRTCSQEDFRCLQNITPDEVYHACLTYLPNP